MWRSMAVVACLAWAVCATEAQAQRGGGQGRFGQGGSTALLRMEEVRKELKITDDQTKKVEEIGQKLAEEMREAFSGGNQNLSEEERAERRKKMTEITAKGDEELGKVLEASQVTRLKQLRLQREGTAALVRAEVAKEVGLSDDQQTKVRDAIGDGRQNFQRLQGLSEEERTAKLAEIQKDREERQKKALDVLTDAQKTKWKEMQGAEFKFPEAKRGGQGGRRRNQDNTN